MTGFKHLVDLDTEIRFTETELAERKKEYYEDIKSIPTEKILKEREKKRRHREKKKLESGQNTVLLKV